MYIMQMLVNKQFQGLVWFVYVVYCRCHHKLVQFTCTHVFCKDT